MVQGVPLTPNFAPPYYYQSIPYIQQGTTNTQSRGPFDFIGQWIQQTPWLPVQVNVPDFFQNIGNGINQGTSNIQQFAQDVGNGVSQFGQNVGSGFSQFQQNVGNGLSQFQQNIGQFGQNVGNGFTTWMQQLGQRVPVIANFVNRPTGTSNIQPQRQPVVLMVPIEYPGGQQLVLSNEAAEAYP